MSLNLQQKNQSLIIMKKVLNLVLCLFVGLMAMAQSPELTVEQHLEDYDYAVKYVEDNYSGFPDKVVDSNRADYESMKTRLRDQVKQGERKGWNAFAEYTAWFNDNHLTIQAFHYDDKGNRIGWTEHYNVRKKRNHYESLMEYKPMPVACKVTDKTFLIRFPSCGGNPDMKWIKNSIKKFKKSHCENLVIDIRGNGGGSDRNWNPYRKLLYDHEALNPTAEYRISPVNLAYIKKIGWPDAPRIKKLSLQNPDSVFVGGGYNLVRYRKVDKSVKKAAIIIDNKVASSGESMVQAIKTCSDRVTVYGRDNTLGCLDYANVAVLPLKHSDICFQMPMSRTFNIAEYGIDATGIAPDVRIDLPLPARLTDNIDEWVIWVAEQLEK